MRKIQYMTLTLFLTFFIGCTGRVETNPIPNDKKFVLPIKNKHYSNTIDKSYIIDFKRFARSKFTNTNYKLAKTKIDKNNNENKLWKNAYSRIKK